MSTFDNPFDPKRGLNRSGCACGRHVSQLEHERDAAPALQCTPVEERREALRGRRRLGGDAGDVSAGRRAPRLPEIGRRLDRARRDLAVLPARDRDRGVRAGRRRSRRRTSRSASSRSPARRRSSWRKPMGFYEKHGLNVEVIKTAGWAVIRDKTINKEYDAAHMLSPMPIAITHGRRLEPDPLHDAGGGEHQRPGDHARHEAQGQARSEVTGRASSSRCRSTIRCTITCCATTSPSTASIPIRTSRSARVPPPEMVANLRADNIDGFLAPDPVNQRAVYDGVGFIHILSKEIWDRHPCCAFAASKEFVTRSPNTYAALLQGDHRRHRLRHQGRRTASRSPKRSRRRTISTSR